MLEGTEKLLKRENQGWKQEEHVRDVRMPYDVARAAIPAVTNIVAAEKAS